MKSVAELLATLDSREPFEGKGGKSGAWFERANRGGESMIVKYLDRERDWASRATGESVPRTVLMWSHGLFGQLPPEIDAAVVDCGFDPESAVGAVLLRDVGESLIPQKAPLDGERHQIILAHMARLHSHFWDFRDHIGLLAMSSRYRMLSLPVAEVERRRGEGHAVPEVLMPRGWEILADVSPGVASLTMGLLDDLAPLLGAIGAQPMTLIHGDWKLDNVGIDPTGRTVLLDWGLPGPAPCLADLTWYLATSGSRLPTSHEESVEAYRDALEASGVSTRGWFEKQLDLALLGTFLILGWQLVQGNQTEFQWWEETVLRAAALLE